MKQQSCLSAKVGSRTPRHYGRKWRKTQTKYPSNNSLSHKRGSEQTDERVAQYFSLYSWLLSTIVHGTKREGEKNTYPGNRWMFEWPRANVQPETPSPTCLCTWAATWQWQRRGAGGGEGRSCYSVICFFYFDTWKVLHDTSRDLHDTSEDLCHTGPLTRELLDTLRDLRDTSWDLRDPSEDRREMWKNLRFEFGIRGFYQDFFQLGWIDCARGTDPHYWELENGNPQITIGDWQLSKKKEEKNHQCWNSIGSWQRTIDK